MRAAAPLFLFLLASCASTAAAPAATQSDNAPATAMAVSVPRLPEAAPISGAEYAARRRALLNSIGDGVVVVFGAPSPEHDYLPFTQDQNFRYLTGLLEPEAAYIAVKKNGRVEERLFVQERDPAREVWEGARLGPEAARQLTGLNTQGAARFLVVLDSLAKSGDRFYTPLPVPLDVQLGTTLNAGQQVIARLRNMHPRLEVESIQRNLNLLRGVKSAAELDRIRRAVIVSALAHREAMRSVQPGMNEFEVRALLEYMFRRNGADGPSYGSIVGSGPNATTLHYQTSDRFMNAGELLLIDASASYAGYASDITRTFPVSGRFTPEQRAVYNVVLAAQKAAESRLTKGATWIQLNEAALAELKKGLAALGLIDSPEATYDCGNTQCPQVALFYIHGLGHGVGLDVHDPDVSQTQAGFGPGSAVTIEPGLYIRADAFDYLKDTAGNRAMIARLRPALEKYRNIGVRIEDVFIFSDSGVERASSLAPREIDDIEALMRERGLDEATRNRDIVEWFRANRGR
jgi:Xaa-Pro aminopeptidase